MRFLKELGYKLIHPFLTRAMSRWFQDHAGGMVSVEYLYWEVSEIRTLLRHLVAERMEALSMGPLTRAAFNYQWDSLPEGEAMLSNPAFRAQVCDWVVERSGLSRDWFAGKKVLDAGCGQGRFTYALAKLGAEVVALDQSPAGLARARAAVESEGLEDRCSFVQANLLKDLPLSAEFDLVWSFGVLHHTGDTYKAFQNVQRLVKPGGYFYLMLYGEPRLSHPDEMACRAKYSRLRQLARNMSPEGIIALIRRECPGEDVHGWFDAIAPVINDTYQMSEIESWLLAAGFRDIRRNVPEEVNHNIIATRPMTHSETQ